MRIKNYDILWINGHCEVFNNFFCNATKKVKIIYDCLDDQIEFPAPRHNETIRDRILIGEKAIIENADFIFCSSDTLKKVITKRYKIENKIDVVNNGIKLNTQYLPRNENLIKKSNKKIIKYIGTISEWFDFELLEKACEKFDQIEFHLYGPTQVEIPYNKKIKYFGIIEHDNIYNEMADADALIMPFKLNDLVRSVNPVKLYEYIYTGKVVLAVHYPETEKFEKYVYLYNDISSFLELCSKITEGNITPKAIIKESHNFCRKNSWDSKVDTIKGHIDTLF